MAKLMSPADRDRARYNIELPMKVDERLQRLSEKHQITKSEVVRSAIKFFAEYDSLEEEGFDLVASKVDAAGNTQTIKCIIS